MNTTTQIFNEAKKQGRRILTEIEAKQIFREIGVNTVATYLASSQKEALALSEQIGFPVVMKIASPDISHKSDAGGVKTGLNNKAEARKAYGEIMASVKTKYPGAGIEGVTVQGMARQGTEIIIGMFKDPQFGPVIMFGLGGIFVEVLKDISFRIIPLAPVDASEMISEINGYSLLQGFRGREPVHIQTIEDILMKVSRFVEEYPEIEEIDLNPIFAYRDGAIAVDARLALEKP